jgi:hypothetical protein
VLARNNDPAIVLKPEAPLAVKKEEERSSVHLSGIFGEKTPTLRPGARFMCGRPSIHPKHPIL